ncbi:hypothetical protein AN639_03605 [Candidatus Epulonipiscium fishelsonii]|uniref:Uncharacterized protein n=1 Tax=Candidatus Epulonipiscium fishelsonii TaxID=77094 RepID=A0ACC8XDE4_9FIRM|nr:hypothetical protein AN396_00760 [Epulopiscium sp. SCG-B11WGA-EpuloA1]ONI41504.1 hypothetical protein AN639_03605 [Epulopiscium sp. SCG-B05WGA-EpuloA1]
MNNQLGNLKIPQKPKVHPWQNDTLFKKIFRDKKELVLLCKGLSGQSNIKEDDIQITTLKENNAIYVQIRNDLSFIIGTDIFLVEQQTNPNPNMPVRQASYYFNTLSDLFGNAVFHLQKKQQLPRPILITFVNGDPKKVPREILTLSDMFSKTDTANNKKGQLKINGRYQNYIEVYVEVIYLNNPANIEFLNQIPSLKGFATFTKAVKDYGKQGYSKEESVEKAIDYTINQNLLVDILLKEKEGVKSMVMAQITQEEWDTCNFQEGRQEGLKEGIKEGRQEGIKEGQQGERRKLIEAVLDILSNEEIAPRFGVSIEEVEEIRKQKQ